MVRSGVAWVKFNGALEFGVHHCPIVVIVPNCKGERGMSFSKISVSFQRFERGYFGLGEGCQCPQVKPTPQSIITVSQSCVCSRRSGVLFDRLLEVADRSLEPLFAPRFPIISATEVCLVGLRIDHRRTQKAGLLLYRDFYADLIDDGFRHLPL